MCNRLDTIPDRDGRTDGIAKTISRSANGRLGGTFQKFEEARTQVLHICWRCRWISHEGGQVGGNLNKLYGRPLQYASAPCKLTFDLLTVKVVFESRVTWVTSVRILVFQGLCYGKGKFRKLIIIHSPAETEPIGRRRSFSEAARPMAGRH